MRPALIWLLSLLCSVAIFAAMGVITHRTLQLERDNARSRADAELQSRIRLALWRMETEASALLVAENSRPPEHYRAFYGTSSPQSARQRSPLLGARPPHIRLHFEIAPSGAVSSPQAPPESDRLAANFLGAADADITAADARMTQLKTLLASHPNEEWKQRKGSGSLSVAPMIIGNDSLLNPADPATVQPAVPGASLVPAATTVISDGSAPGPLAPGQTEGGDQRSLILQGGQNELNLRQGVYSRIAQNAATTANNASQQVPVISPAPQQNGITLRGNILPGNNTPLAPGAPLGGSGNAIPGVATIPNDGTLGLDNSNAPVIPSLDEPFGQVTPFRPLWLDGELFLMREVVVKGLHFVQGVWLDEGSLRASMLATIADILPRAALVPVEDVKFAVAKPGRLMRVGGEVQADPLALVGLPWRLQPNELPQTELSSLTPMRITLAIAWAGALLAAIAAWALLFGVTRLSERRASFVSSVTHELRTPLTTFRLYSEMLEQDMVPDGPARTQYLRTLRTEAERLNHLVDNVLAYSRIERSKQRSRFERLELPGWLDRVRTRFEDRAKECNMEIEVEIKPEAEHSAAETDATALEQIVFNLVDNACKYAGDRCAEPVIHITLAKEGRWVEFRVADSGPGVPKAERKRLFRPFHKSAEDAALSKPGVGLGLALCRRLAAALGGSLNLAKADKAKPGACFVLRLPAAA